MKSPPGVNIAPELQLYSSETLPHSGASDSDLGDDGDADMIVVSEIPELSTWGMMLLGFAALGASGYRRDNAATFAAQDSDQFDACYVRSTNRM